MWWLFPTVVLCGLAECLGWSARLWSSQNPPLLTPYLIQISATIIAPTPLVAANFIILGKIINKLGSRYSRLSAKWYTIIFCSCDVVSLVVQAVGGATASTAVSNNDDPANGGHIMLGGIGFQMVSITVYVICAIEFFVRFWKNKPVRGDDTSHKTEEGWTARMDIQMKIMIIGVTFNTTCLFIRAVYRTIELADGWTGRIISTQLYFNVLDGAMITLAIYTLNFVHPGVFLHGGSSTNLVEDKEKLPQTSTVTL
ncbi:hypothetical protein PILCRDRAFT_817160 [Piloderma croceum F 1598]|uniref:RTA1 like protein n=1 Tax=Piloderma croceum (strain F 1598) TaxID=765440 RepID=A0A0C3G3L6_PILCF|nr:hypothetical protein PILCRDRAFT_817160 [Piloderma croceum F 1598]